MRVPGSNTRPCFSLFSKELVSEGPCEYMVVDPFPMEKPLYLVSGSAQSVVSLWDIRFNIRSAYWKLPTVLKRIDSMCMCSARNNDPSVLIAAGEEEVV